MLLVKTEVRPSPIHGLGLFAAEYIAAGTVIARRDDRFAIYFTDEQVKTLPPHAAEYMQTYAWREPDGRWCASLDHSKFINHSFAPNTVLTVSDDGWHETRAAYDIGFGAELCEDYRTFDPDFEQYGKEWK
jgi:SET domain-containing protein